MRISDINLNFPIIETKNRGVNLLTNLNTYSEMNLKSIKRAAAVGYILIDYNLDKYKILKTIKLNIIYDAKSLLFMNPFYAVDHELEYLGRCPFEDYISLFRRYMKIERNGFISGDIIDEIEAADKGPDIMEKVLRVAELLKKYNYA